MSQFVETPTKSFPAGAALAVNRRVKLTSGELQYAGASDVAIGTLEAATFADTNYASGFTNGTVRLVTAQGTRKVVAVDAIAAGDPVYAAASGKVSAAGTVVEGRALEASAADDDVIEILSIANTDISATISGTNAATFQADADLAKPRMAIGSQTGGTGDFKAVLRPPTTLTADRVFTLEGDAAATLVNKAGAQTLTDKTLTSPVLTTPLIDDSDAGCTVTSADQTNAAAVATIPDIGDAADEFVMKDTAQTLTNKTLTSPVHGGLAKQSHTVAPVAAAGSTVADAGQLASTNVAHITSDGATKGVKLPTTAAGHWGIVINNSGTAAAFYAADGGTVNGGAGDASIVVPASKGVLWFATGADTIIAFDLTALATAS